MKVVALIVTLVCASSALELRPQFPGIFPGMPQMPQMGLGQLPFPQIPQMPQMPQMGMGLGMGQMPNFGMGQFPQIPFSQFGQMPQFGAQIPRAPQTLPVAAPAAAPVAAPVAAPAAAPVAVAASSAPQAAAPAPVAPAAVNPQDQVNRMIEAAKSAVSGLNLPTAQSQKTEVQTQEPAAPPTSQFAVADIAKWAETMGLPKLSDKDLGRLVEMQQTMVSRLQSLPHTDIHEMRSQQTQLAEQMDQLLAQPDESGIDKFQATQEQLMNQWAQKLGLPTVSAEEHSMMRTQLRVMFDKMSHLPKSQLEELRSKHEQIKSLIQQA